MTALIRSLFKLTATLLLTFVPGSLLAQSAELFLQSMNAPSGVFEQGDSFSVQSTTNNIGDVTSGPYTITFNLSEDLLVSEDDIPIGSQNRAGLASATVDQTPVTVTIPADMTPGQYFINGFIDYTDDFSQNNMNYDATPIDVVVSSENTFLINTAISDAWFNPVTDGQGFLIIVWEKSEQIFLSWFTYDTERPPQDAFANFGEPGHRWLTALGSYVSDTALLDVYLTAGGVLDAPTPAPGPAMLVGTMEIVWTTCNEGILEYDLPALGLSNEIPIERIVLDNIEACEMAQLE